MLELLLVILLLILFGWFLVPAVVWTLAIVLAPFVLVGWGIWELMKWAWRKYWW